MNFEHLAIIIAAAASVSIGAIGPALAEGRAIVAAMEAIARQPEVKQRLMPLAAVTIGSTAPEFAAFIRAEYDRWSKLIQSSGIKPS